MMRISHIRSITSSAGNMKGSPTKAIWRTPAYAATLGKVPGMLVSLFHPRRDVWGDHFELRGFVIEPLTPVGEVAARLLKLNLDGRVAERRLLIRLERLPGL
jgi:hypothetical protein